MDKPDPNSPQAECKRSVCPAASALDILGDKWTLLVVRDLLMGKSTYGELQASPEKVPTNILADRLKRLEAAGLLYREPYQQRPVRYAYRLTEMGQDLGPVLEAMMLWASRYIPGTLSAEEVQRLIAKAWTKKTRGGAGSGEDI